MQVLENTVDACKVVEACLTCTDLRFQMVLVMSVTIIMLLVMDHQVRVTITGVIMVVDVSNYTHVHHMTNILNPPQSSLPR